MRASREQLLQDTITNSPTSSKRISNWAKAGVALGAMLSLTSEAGAQIADFGDALINAAERKDDTMVGALLKSGANPNQTSEFGITPLMRAAYKGATSTAKMLIEAGANVNAQDMGGATALHMASKRGYADTVNLLLGSGANPNIQDGDGWTPMMRASYAQSKETVAALIAHGADVNIVTAHGETALMKASAKGNSEIASLLVGAGADPTLSTNGGTTAVDIASRQREGEIKEMLVAHVSNAVPEVPVASEALAKPVTYAEPVEAKPIAQALAQLEPSQGTIDKNMRFVYTPAAMEQPIPGTSSNAMVLGGFANEADALASWQRIRDSNPDLLDGMDGKIAKANDGYAIIVNVASSEKAGKTCETLGSRGVSCKTEQSITSPAPVVVAPSVQAAPKPEVSPAPAEVKVAEAKVEPVMLPPISALKEAPKPAPAEKKMEISVADPAPEPEKKIEKVEKKVAKVVTKPAPTPEPAPAPVVSAPAPKPAPVVAAPAEEEIIPWVVKEESQSNLSAVAAQASLPPKEEPSKPEAKAESFQPAPLAQEEPLKAPEMEPIPAAAPEKPVEIKKSPAPVKMAEPAPMQAPAPVEHLSEMAPAQAAPAPAPAPAEEKKGWGGIFSWFGSDSDKPEPAPVSAEVAPMPDEPVVLTPPAPAPMPAAKPEPIAPIVAEPIAPAPVPVPAPVASDIPMRPAEPLETIAPAKPIEGKQKELMLPESVAPAPAPIAAPKPVPMPVVDAPVIKPVAPAPIMAPAPVRQPVAAPAPKPAPSPMASRQPKSLGNLPVLARVEVAEAIQVPVTAGSPKPSAVISRYGSPSQPATGKSYWAEVRYFNSSQSALSFWDEVSTARGDLASGVRVRTSQPLQRTGGNNVTLQIGPFASQANMQAVCSYVQSQGLGCFASRELGASGTASTVRERIRTQGYYSGGGQVDQASMDMGTGGAWLMLGTFGSHAEGMSMYESLRDSHANLLGKYGYRIVSPRYSSAGRAVFRLNVGPFPSMNAASGVCEKLKARGVRCIAVEG